MRLVHEDFHWKRLILDHAGPLPDRPLAASVTVIQPQGYRQELTVSPDRIQLRDGAIELALLYPMIDDGRYDPSHGTWNGAWEMGSYRFAVEVAASGRTVASDTLEIDPSEFFPRDHRYVIAVDAVPQIIECAPRQALYTDEPEARFTARIRSHRVNRCHVSVDVTARECSEPLAGPWRLSLTHQSQDRAFPIDGWPDGEYWIRLRVLIDGSPAGPWCVRKFWKQSPLPALRPAVLDLAGHPEVLVDDYCFDAVHGVQFVPDPFERPKAPVVDGSAPHEEEGLQFTSLAWNADAARWEAEYQNFLVAGDRLSDHETRAGLRMLAVSGDGRTWTRPSLSAMAYGGSTLNNILSDDRGPRTQRERELEHDIEHATFRFYDEQRDGTVDLDHVFIASGKGRFPFACKSLQISDSATTLAAAERNEVPGMRQDGLGVLGEAAAPDDGAFRPRPGEFWPFEKRGDEYLVLSREPVLYLGIGMDLMHTTESMRCHVERVGARRRLFWYFRPGSPAYPPHGAECDNMHMCLRCLGVMWTDDGLTYLRRFALGPDAFDRTGTQFYAMGMLQRFGTSGDAVGRPVLDKLDGKINQAFVDRTLYLGSALLHHGIEQTQDPELIWTRDLLHFHRFRDGRRPLVERGPGGSFDGGMLRDRYRYVERNGEWLYAYVGVNTRHNGYGIMAGDFRDPADLRERRPSHALASYFSTWEGHLADGRATRYLPALARGRAYRVAHAEPDDVEGVLTTGLLRVGQPELRINAATERGGSIVVRVEDEEGRPLGDPVRFEGDSVDAPVVPLDGLRDRPLRIHFELVRARLYAFLL